MKPKKQYGLYVCSACKRKFKSKTDFNEHICIDDDLLEADTDED